MSRWLPSTPVWSGLKLVIRRRTGEPLTPCKLDKPRTVVNIEKAAPWCVGSNLEGTKWKAPEVSDSSPHTGEDGYLVLPTMPDDDKAVA